MGEKNYNLMRILLIISVGMNITEAISHNYGDALSKSLLFFEGQRSGRLPSTQRLTWRKDSALRDGFDMGVDLTGGYYDAGDNVKYNFPMSFTTTLLAWGVIEYGGAMGPDFPHALEAIRWSTDYLLKSTSKPGIVFAQVGDPNADHNCWERPEDMDTPRTVYAVTEKAPGSEVSAEIAGALASSSLVFRGIDNKYSDVLLQRAIQVFSFADNFRGSYNNSIGYGVCPFYCDFNGYQDELIWAAAWLHKATNNLSYWNYVEQNVQNFKQQFEANLIEFGWDAKQAGVTVLVSQHVLSQKLEATTPFISYADSYVCSIMPESPTKNVKLTPGGLMYRQGSADLQRTTALSFLLLAYARNLEHANRVVGCNNVVITPRQIINFARTQVDYILGSNPLGLSYMVGYGNRYPERIHHRGSSIPSIAQHPPHIECKAGSAYFLSKTPNPNLLIGAVVGGPNNDDSFVDDRVTNAPRTEPTTYITAPLVGLLAYFNTSASP